MQRWLLVLPALMLVLSGCAGGAATKTVIKSVDKPGSTQGIDDPGKGKIIGVVVNDEALPVEGASVALFAAGALTPTVATSGAAGDFAFLGIEPGTYLLVVQKLGFEDATDKNILVEAGVTLEKTIALVALPSNEPHKELFEYAGTVSAWGYKTPTTEAYLPLSCGTACNTNYRNYKTTDRPEGIQNIVGELQWSNTQAAGGNLIYLVTVQQAGSNLEKTFIRQEGPSPIKVVVATSDVQKVLAKNDPKCSMTSKTCDLDMYVYAGTGNTNAPVDVALALTQGFTSKVSIFFRMEAPAGYSAF